MMNGHVDQIQTLWFSDRAMDVAVDYQRPNIIIHLILIMVIIAIDTVIGTVADISVVGSQLVAGSVQTGQLFFVLQMLDEVTRSADYSSHPERPIVGK
jgi:hypothetical protein